MSDDAARYRWIKEHTQFSDFIALLIDAAYGYQVPLDVLQTGDPDKIIDAAIARYGQ